MTILRSNRLAASFAAVLLAACGSSSSQSGGGTEGEAQALDDAAEIIEQRRIPAPGDGSGAPVGDEPVTQDTDN
uniref:hypothetical protein n=1 Tax=Parerythrobacter lutipelagi TaxID=1964208 RepID=UPI0010FA4B75|nr:hypothetical protein [Parerythrobacter lutipelagi]